MSDPASDYTPSSLELDRRTFRKKQTTKSVIISIISTIALAVVIYLTLSNSSGWNRVRETFFNGEYFISALPEVLKGLLVNLRILVFALIGTAILSLLLAIARTTRTPVLFPLRFIARAYTDIFRGIPMIVLLYLIGFGIPGLEITEGRIDAAQLGTAAIIIGYSAYVSEVLRAGIESIHPSQRAAARSLGLTYNQTTALIVLPQAIRKVIPALMNDFVAMQKDVGLVSVLGILDAVREAQIEVAHSFNFTPYVAAAVVFVCLSFPFIRLTDWYSKKVQQREFAQGAF
ncbi:MAG: amino acid ABC transporter permease [Bifidobacteriaceae bacterium]|nr:amino acid ABC transporter permease [Bifidobacteriaceae bacterium]